MKKFLLSFLSLLLLGFGYIQADQVTVSGTVTVEGNTPLPDDLKLAAGVMYGGGVIVDLPASMPLNTPVNYSVTVNVPSSVSFALGRDVYALYGDPYPGEWYLDAANKYKSKTFDVTGSTMTVDLVISSGGGGGEEEGGEVTLIGKVGIEGGSDCINPYGEGSGVSVSISGGSVSKTSSIDYRDYSGFYDKVGDCSFGYLFSKLPYGSYTLTCSKEGYETATQTVEISAADGNEKVVNLTLKQSSGKREYTFSGSLWYQDANWNTIYVSNAKVIAYADAAGTEKLGETTTDQYGNWSMTVECEVNDKIYFDVEHEDYICASKKEVGTAEWERNGVSIPLSPKMKLTLLVNDPEMGQVEGAGGYAKDAWVTIKATPNAGYEFRAWKQGGSTFSTQAEYGFTISEDMTLTAEFGIPTATLLGAVTDGAYGSSSCFYGADVTISKGAYSASTTTTYSDETTSSKTGCYYTFRFTGLEAGTYTLTYSKEGYATETQEITITQADLGGVVIAPRITLNPSYTLTLNTEGEGTVTGDGTYRKGQQVTATAQAAEGYRFKGWYSTGGELLETNAEYLITMDADYTLTAKFGRVHTLTLSVNETMGTVTGADKGANVLDEGTELTLTAAPNTGYRFKAWKKDGTEVSTDATYIFTLTADVTVEAVFIRQYTLTATVNNNAYGSVSGVNNPYEAGATATIKATSTDTTRYRFKGWQSGGVTVSTANPLSVTMNRDTTLQAVFVPLHTLAAVSNNTAYGTVAKNPNATRYEKGKQVTLTATRKEPVDNYRFKGWVNTRNTSDTVSKSNPLTVTVNSDTALTAIFVRLWSFSVASNNTDWGTVSGAASSDYEAGQSLTVTAAPKGDRFRFKGWVKGNDTVSRELTYTTDPLSAAVTLRAIFISLHQLNLVAVPAEGGTLTGGGLYERGRRATVTATPNEGYRFGAWMSGNVKKTENTTYTTIALTADTTLRAIFVPVAKVQLSANNSSYGTVTGEGTFDKDSIVAIEATPNAGHRFVAWVSGSDTVSKKAAATFRLSRDTAIMAVFVPRHTLTLAVNLAEAGTVYGGNTYDQGQKVTIGVDFEDEDNYRFKGWINTNNPGDTVSREPSFKYTVNGNASLTAVFVRLYKLTLSRNNANGGTVTGAGTYEQGQKVAINAQPAVNYRFKAWVRTPNLSDTVSRRADTTVTMDANRGFTAVFVRTFTLAVSANDNNMGTVTGSGTYDNNQQVTVTATANPGYVFMGWKDHDDATEYTSTEATYTFTINSGAPLSLTAEFLPLRTLTLAVNDPGKGSVRTERTTLADWPGSHAYEQGRTVQLIAAPKEGYRFVAWLRGAVSSNDTASKRATYSFVLNRDTTFTAIFDEEPVIPDSAFLYLAVKDNVGGTVTGEGKYEAGEEVTVKATPAAGYRFEAWMDGEYTESKDTVYTFTMSAEGLTLTAVFVPVATLTLSVNDPEMGSITTQVGTTTNRNWPGSRTYDKGTAVTITAASKEDDDYHFKVWVSGKDTVSKNASFIMTMNRDTALTAVFVPMVTLALEVDEGNMGEVSGDGSYEKGQTATVTATAKPGFRFKGWRVDPEHPDVFVSTEATYTFTISEDLTLTAVFVPEYTVTLTADPNKGTATFTGNGTYAKGDRVTITATPLDGYRFEAWTENGTVVTRENPRTFTIAANRNLTAVFVPDSSILTLRLTNSSNPAGSIVTEGGVRVTGEEKEIVYRNGATVTLTAIPNAYYRFEAWMNYTVTISTQNPFSFTINRDTALRALFVRDSATITLEVNDAGMGTVKGDGRFAKGNSYMIEAEPKDGYAFREWTDRNGKPVSTEPHFEIELVRDTTLQAVFFCDSSYLTLECDAEMGSVAGAGRYRNHKAVTVTATPHEGYLFKAWMSGETQISDDAEYEFTISCDTTLRAVFVVDSVNVDLAVADHSEGMGTVQGAGRYAKGSTLTIRAIPETGYAFKAWMDENERQISTARNYSLKVDRDTMLFAVFELRTVEPDSFDVVLRTEGNGTVTGAGRYEQDEEVTVTAVADEGYAFKAWKDEAGTEVSDNAVYKFFIDRDTVLTAVFEAVPAPPAEPDSFDVRLQVNNLAWGTVTGEGRYEEGTEVSVTATANEGYEFKAWKAGEIQIAATAEYKFIIDRDTALTAVFEAKQTPPEPETVRLTLNVNDAAMGSVTGAGEYEKGASVTAKAIAHEGYAFKAWKEGETEVSTEAEYTFTLNGDRTLTAVFEAKTANEDRAQDAWSAYAENHTVVLRSEAACQYEVYNVAGVLVKRAKTLTNECRIAVDNSGLYIIRRVTAHGISVKKVMVR